MKNRIEWHDLRNMGATESQLDTYSNSDPLDIVQIDENTYRVSGVVDAETDAQGVLELLDEAPHSLL